VSRHRPDDLFDLILVDEAHHSPTRTWDELFAAFPAAKRLLVTATPFRRDKREIRGRIIYVYPLREAYRDGIFGQIQFLAVHPQDENSDVAIAKAAEREFRADRETGLRHCLMVRTDRKTRANELAQVYADHTSLRLRTIHSGHSFTHVKRTIRALRGGDLDGIICVDMLGEGFDFPHLKIAAIHAPHKSLAVTLQFIGRFARTNADDIGMAKFLAVPAEIEIESKRLYEQDAVWQEMIVDLSRTRIDEEVFVRETLEHFVPSQDEDEESEDVSLFALRPFHHVKVYQMSGEVDLFRPPALPPGFAVVRRWDSPDLPSTVFVTREVRRPKWVAVDAYPTVAHHLFVLYYDTESRLLFVNSTLKQNEVYQVLAQSLTTGAPKILPLNQINKVLLGMENAEFYNVGMRNRLQSTTAESYRIITGPAAHRAITESDGQLYHRGHVFGGDTESTIGFSSASKIWSNARDRIPHLIEWCQRLASRLTSASLVQTNSPLDHLDVGVTVTELPPGVLGALWDIDVFRNPPQLGFRDGGGRARTISLLDLDVRVLPVESTAQSIRVLLECPEFQVALDYVLNGETWFRPLDAEQLDRVWVERVHGNVSLVTYLDANPMEFFFSNFSRLLGQELFVGPRGAPPSVADDQFNVVNWSEKGVDITVEFGACDGDNVSIHDCLETELPHLAEVVFYDHGSGEIADFITFTRTGEGLEVALFHCKGSSGAAAGQRVADFYEVCGQIVKSLRWVENNTRLMKHLTRRLNRGSRYVKGSAELLRALLDETRQSRITYRLVVVQPGISRERLGDLAVLLAATGDYVAKSRGQRFEVWCSA
jgi:hypothetical protein